ncbi:MAG: DUF2807 domain-containing protein [Eudoraea sp.]|nr:DUF2807 domain-containing protein [Eudoraea sp.]
MKNLILLALLLACCGISAQRKPKIKGNKAVIDVREDLPAYNAIELNDDLEIFLQKSSNTGYAITADDNLIDVLKFQVKDSTLIISSFYKITSKKKLEITVNYEEIQAISMRDGRIRMKDMIRTDHLRVNTYGSSKLELNANAPVMDINMEGNSSGDFNLDSDSLNITLKDRIDVKIYAVSETNTIEMFKSASARMEGTTDTLRIKLLGSANLRAQKLEAASISATLEETPSARVYAFKEIELSSSGSSKTYLYGNPKITILDFLDTSELYKRND